MFSLFIKWRETLWRATQDQIYREIDLRRQVDQGNDDLRDDLAGAEVKSWLLQCAFEALVTPSGKQLEKAGDYLRGISQAAILTAAAKMFVMSEGAFSHLLAVTTSVVLFGFALLMFVVSSALTGMSDR